MRWLAFSLFGLMSLSGLFGEAHARSPYKLDKPELGDPPQIYTGVPYETAKQWEGQVDLFDIAFLRLDRPYLSERLDEFVPEKGNTHFLIRLGFENDTKVQGRITDCTVLATNHSQASEAKKAACEALTSMDLLAVSKRRKFIWGADFGYLTVDLVLSRAPDFARPFVQAKGRSGIPVEPFMWYLTREDSLRPSCFFLDQRISQDEKQSVCDIYERQLARSDGKTSDGKPHRRSQTGRIYLKRDRSKQRIMIDYSAVGPSRYNEPIYEPFEPDPALELTDDHGTFRFRAMGEEYPERAKKTDVTGRTEILLEFAAGDLPRPESCRILASSGSSVLDNASCNLAARRAQWRWKIGSEQFNGGWRKVPVVWSLNGRVGRDRLPDPESSPDSQK